MISMMIYAEWSCRWTDVDAVMAALRAVGLEVGRNLADATPADGPGEKRRASNCAAFGE